MFVVGEPANPGSVRSSRYVGIFDIAMRRIMDANMARSRNALHTGRGQPLGVLTKRGGGEGAGLRTLSFFRGNPDRLEKCFCGAECFF
jgi:hypothetical protein